MIEQIAKIRKTALGWEDHGIFTVWLDLDYGGSGQGAGGYALDKPIHRNGKFVERVGTAEGMDFVIGIIRATGSEKWEDVQGKTVIALREEGFPGPVVGLKPLPTEKGQEFLFRSVSNSDNTPGNT